MSKPIAFSTPDGREVVLKDESFVLDRERKISALEQAALLRIVCPGGKADGIPAKLSSQTVAHLKHNRLVDKGTGKATEDGEYLAEVLLERAAAKVFGLSAFHRQTRRIARAPRS